MMMMMMMMIDNDDDDDDDDDDNDDDDEEEEEEGDCWGPLGMSWGHYEDPIEFPGCLKELQKCIWSDDCLRH